MSSILIVLFVVAFAGMIAMHLRGHGAHGTSHAGHAGAGGHGDGHSGHGGGGCGGHGGHRHDDAAPGEHQHGPAAVPGDTEAGEAAGESGHGSHRHGC